MTTSDVLSEDEKSTLLENDEQTQDAAEGISEQYDFSEQHRKSIENSAALKLIDVATLDEFQIQLSNLFRFKVEIREAASDLIEFDTFLNRQSGCLTLNVINIEEFNSSVILVVDSSLIFAAIEVLFGGNLKASMGLEKKLGRIDRTVSDIIVDKLCAGMKKSWATIQNLTFKLDRTIINPLFTPDISDDAKVFVNKYEVIIDEVKSVVELCIPKTVVEHLNDNYTNVAVSDAEKRLNTEWSNALRKSVLDANIAIACYLSDVDISLKDMANLKPGDIIPLRDPETSHVFIENIELYKGKCGSKNGNHAVEINEFLLED